MKVEDIYRQIALTYRLSLKSMAKIMKKSEIDAYNYLCFGTNQNAFQFLFEKDAPCETEREKARKELRALHFLTQFKNGKKEEKVALLHSLLAVDEEYKNIKKRFQEEKKISSESYQVISKYRLKYGISQINTAQDIDIAKTTIQRQEESYEDLELKARLKMLNEFHREFPIKEKNGYKR